MLGQTVYYVTGLYISGTSGSVPQRLSVNGWMNSGGDYPYEISTTSVTRDSSYGFGFALQDSKDGVLHIGEKFGGVAQYSTSFANFHGLATSYYVHTWNSGKVKSVTFNANVGISGIGGGISITYENVDYTFSLGSGGQASF
ncbi:hypothetical protein NE562_05755 [Butyricicoccus faecihominis]|uniref:hypothetical protein n=1 Tax=Butyricicoccus faecihominis TaxID=1712515 RepID=UPI00247A1BDA|nr:hypothetical protein [Butyricicoccus faecihominis]MCQ5129158.1 hypothetical protein [Butyricicoccus faecihominis]